MRLLCPNCQKELTVLEQYAGQLMKCPLCAGTFMVPALPQPPTAPPPQPETYSLAAEPPPPVPQPATAPPPTLEQPQLQAAPEAPPPVPPPPPGEYQRTVSFTMRPEVVPWIAPTALLTVLLVFLLFSWVGLYPGGIGVYTQTGFQAAFDLYSLDEVWSNKMVKFDKDKDAPGVGVLLIVYFVLLIPSLLLAIAAAVLPMLKVNLPPAVQQIVPWRWAIVGGVTLLAFLFLVIQLVVGFPLETKVTNKVVDEFKKGRDNAKTEEDRKMIDIAEGAAIGSFNMQRTSCLRLVVFLHFLAIVGAGLQFWLDRRGPRPAPRIDLSW